MKNDLCVFGMLLCLFLLPACNSDGEDSTVDGDLTDGDATDGDVTDGDVSGDDDDDDDIHLDGDEPDGDTQEDGDDEPSDGDNPLPDGDEDGDEIDGDSEDSEDDVEQVDGDEEVCGEWELAEFGEDEERPTWQITSLWETAQIVACEAPVEETAGAQRKRKDSTWTTTHGSNEAWALAVWSDGADVVLFGDERGLWRYEESPTPTLRCDPTTPGTVYTLQGTGTESSAVVWAGLTGQVARLENNEWTVETLPSPLTGPVLAIALDGTRIAAQTLEGVAVRQTTGWEAVTGCESFGIAFPENSPVETGQAAATGLTWHDDKLYVGAVDALLEIDPQAGTCRALCTWATPENAAPLRFVVQGHSDCGLWATVLEYREEPFQAESSPFQSIGICHWNGTWQETIGELPILNNEIPNMTQRFQVLRGHGNKDGFHATGLGCKLGPRWYPGSYIWSFMQRLTSWPSHRTSETESRWPEVVLSCYEEEWMDVCDLEIPDTTWPPIDFWLHGNVGYYSPGFSKVTFGE